VAVIMVLEKIGEGMFDGQAIVEATKSFWAHRNRDHILASVILISIAFLFYNTFAVVDRALGKKGLAGVLRSPLADESSA
jgi:hypothetical protein